MSSHAASIASSWFSYRARRSSFPSKNWTSQALARECPAFDLASLAESTILTTRTIECFYLCGDRRPKLEPSATAGPSRHCSFADRLPERNFLPVLLNQCFCRLDCVHSSR